MSIKEKSDQAFSHAIDSDPSSLFPRTEVLNNVYYLIGFLGNQAQKHAPRLADGSTRQLCMLLFAKKRFHVRNKGGESAVLAIIEDESIPTRMGQEKEHQNGLRYADGVCFKYFVAIEHIFATVATANNFIACGCENT